MNLFYTPQLNKEDVHFLLSEEESAHAIRVLRMKIGDRIFSTDGNGFFYKGVMVNEHPKKSLVKIEQVIPDPVKQKFELSIAIAPTKMIDRFEWFLEKATEIGCKEIIPIKCHHSEREVIKPDRLKKVLVSAMKQCLKSRLPVLHEMVRFKSFLSSSANFLGQKFIGHIPELDYLAFPPQSFQNILLNRAYVKGNNALLMIGPEGGFSADEMNWAVNHNCTSISLGTSRLRVETAGVVACSILNSLND
jgi:16S rRNA (uracil1498-N3)-methyltransferase